jgi:hypothetical protein
MSEQADTATDWEGNARHWESNARYCADMAERYFARMEQAAQKLRSLTRYKLERHGGDDGGGDLVEDSNGHWLDADEVGWVVRDYLEQKP